MYYVVMRMLDTLAVTVTPNKVCGAKGATELQKVPASAIEPDLVGFLPIFKTHIGAVRFVEKQNYPEDTVIGQVIMNDRVDSVEPM